MRVDSGRSAGVPSRKPRCAASRSTTVRVIGPPSYPVAVSRSAATRLDLAEVVAPPAHPLAQLGIGPPGLLRGGGPLGLDAGQRAVQARPATPAPRSAAAAPAGPPGSSSAWNAAARCARLQLDLQRRPAARARPPPAARTGRCPAPPASVVSSGQLGLPLAVLDQRQRRRADRRGLGDVVQRQARRPCAGAAAAGRSSADRGLRRLSVSIGADRPCADVEFVFWQLPAARLAPPVAVIDSRPGHVPKIAAQRAFPPRSGTG